MFFAAPVVQKSHQQGAASTGKGDKTEALSAGNLMLQFVPGFAGRCVWDCTVPPHGWFRAVTSDPAAKQAPGGGALHVKPLCSLGREPCQPLTVVGSLRRYCLHAAGWGEPHRPFS